MDDIKAKQQIVEKIQASSTILVTVSDSPSVDALSAAIGFTLLLDTMEKHATSVFSGSVPPAIAFLEPEKILDDTTDSLRDFIIALDKEKADHLRYKVEGDSVKIFITPYKTTITADDLDFSQGDYNVELVIALGVDNQDHLDGALSAHGQILHDATVITMTAGEQTSTLGGIDWHDDQASSLSEMVASLSEAFKTDKKKSLLDAQTATALLTGIVAQTDRFSNQHTTARVMTIASQLMAAGADQQLIATKLNEGGQADEEPTEAPQPEAGLSIQRKNTEDSNDKEEAPKDSQSVAIHHEEFETLEDMDKRVKHANLEESAATANAALDHTANAVPAGPYALPDDGAPELGGTLNATTEQAADDARHAAENDQNKTILSHTYLQDESQSESTPAPVPTPEPLYPVTPPQPAAVPTPQDLGLPMPPPLPGDAPLADPAGPYALPPEPTEVPERLGDILAPEPVSEPAPQPSPSPEPLNPEPVTPPSPLVPPTDPTIPPVAPPQAPEGPYAAPPADPTQFQIPGQQ